MKNTLEELKYPIGKYNSDLSIDREQIEKWILELSSFPSRLVSEVQHLNDEQLDTPYRAGGWTIRQVIHHCADSHMNSYIRFKLALTEDNPTIKPYFEARWSELVDSKVMPIASSIKIIEGVHSRWTTLLENLTETELTKTFMHPESGKSYQLNETIGLYAWHSNHHLAHIVHTKTRHNWQ